MDQEVNISVKLTLSTESNLSNEDMAKDIESAFNTLFATLNSPLSNILSKYQGGDLLLDVTKVDVLEVKQEAEIYDLN